MSIDQTREDALVLGLANKSDVRRSARLQKLKAAVIGAQAFNPDDAPVASGVTVTNSTTLPAGIATGTGLAFGTLAFPSKFRTYGGRRAANSSSNRIYMPVASVTPDPAGGNLTGLLLGGFNDYAAWAFGCGVQTDSSLVAFEVTGFTTRAFRVLVDGQYVSKTPTFFASNTSPQFVILDFGGVYKQREIYFESAQNIGIYSVRIEPTCQITAPTPRTGINALMTGDSYTEGQGASVVGMQSWAPAAARRLGWDDCRQVAVGGTGYINVGGSRQALINQIPRWSSINTDIPASSVDVICCFSGYNDFGFGTPTQIGDAATAAIQLMRSTYPDALILIGGVWSGSRNNDPTTLANEAAILAAAQALNDPWVKTIPVSSAPAPWQFGNGRVTAPNGTGINDRAMSSDGVHPGDYGHADIALRASREIRGVILAMT